MIFKKIILDLFFPIQCLGGCQTWDTWLCPHCRQQLPSGRKIKLKDNKYLDGLYYLSEYQNPLIQKLIHQLKYRYSQEIAVILGQELKQIIDQNFDYIIPVPLHKKRRCERGFNQAELIARHINQTKILNQVIIRKKYTQTQAQLNKNQRIVNTKNAFTLNKKHQISLKNKKIILVDDVYTTGNTLTQAAKIINSQNPSSIWAAVIAKR